MALRNLLIESFYSRTGNLPSSEQLDKDQVWWLTYATDPHTWDTLTELPSLAKLLAEERLAGRIEGMTASSLYL